MLKEKVKNYFNTYDNLKVLFYFSENKEYQEELEHWDLEGIELIIADNALFNLKYRLEYELNDKKVFIYFARKFPNEEERLSFPIMDLIYANKVLQIDDVAELMEKYGLKQYQRELVKKYINYLKTKKVQTVLGTTLKPENFEEKRIKKGLASSFLDFNRDEDETLILAKMFTLLKKSNEKNLNNFIRKIEQIDFTDQVCKWLDEYFEVETNELTRNKLELSLKKLKYTIITQNISRTLPSDNYHHLKINSPQKINLINALINDWHGNYKLGSQIEDTFEELASDVKEDEIVKVYGMESDFGYYTNNLKYVIIENIIGQIPYQPEKSIGILSKLKSNTFETEIELDKIIEFLNKSANVYRLLNSIRTYILDKGKDYLEKYSKNFSKIDYYYRKAVWLLDTIRSFSLFEKLSLDTYADDLHKQYEEHLKKLNTEWMKCLSEHNFDFNSISVLKQYEFFKNYLKDSETKVAVIISDGLRYEAASDLLEQMHIDPKHEAKMGYMLSSLPSNTKQGMANLLPNGTIEFDGGSFNINGTTIEGLENREKILQQYDSNSRVVSFDTLTKMSQGEARELFKSNIVYIYHNVIDAFGDDRKTESQTFDAVEKAISDLIPMIKKIHSSYNVSDVIITSDHGFLYNYRALPESLYEPLPDNKNAVINHNRFSILNKETKTNSYLFDLSLCSNISGEDLKITMPKAINRYKRQGHSVHYVHGGASLQEMVIPVIESTRHREAIADKVTFKLLNKELKIVSGAIKLKLIQEKPIGSAVKGITLSIGLYDNANELVSNEEIITLESASMQPTERIKEVILNLKPKASKTNFVTLKIFDKEKEPDKLNPSLTQKVVNQTLIQSDF